MLKSKLKSKGGFTLLELVVVMAILAVLVTVAIPVVNYTVNSAVFDADIHKRLFSGFTRAHIPDSVRAAPDFQSLDRYVPYVQNTDADSVNLLI